MSLLMDALRKAEEAKRAAGGDGPPASEPGLESPGAAVEGIPAELALEPMTRDPQAAQASSARSPRPADAQQAQRDAINNAFAAKGAARDPADRAFMVALVSVAALGLLGIGFYIWWQMQPRSNLAPVPTVQAPAARPAPPAPPPPALEAAPAPSSPSIAESALSAVNAVTNSIADIGSDKPVRPARDESAAPIRITHGSTRVNPLLEQGYAALQQGNLPQAQQAYERMLASDPKNVDALYGLAAVAVHRQQTGLAEDYYLRILEADPRDPVAHAGLAGIKGRSGGAESRLKTLIAEQPNVAQLHFALGNVYAQEQRWRDAQQSYFLAYKNDSENPDAAFNLAVSLDQLHQDRLAAQYYGEALRLAAGRPAAFSREQAQARLRDLQGPDAR